MNRMRRRFLSVAGAAVAGLAAPSFAWAQSYLLIRCARSFPSHPAARPTLSPVDRAGAVESGSGSSSSSRTFPVRAATSARAKAAKAAPDGYTLLFRLQLACRQSVPVRQGPV